MSPTKNAIRRRIGLLAGSSFIAASLSAGAVVLAPAAALAANECGDPSANGAAADILTCATPPTYATGLDYSTTTDGSLTVILQNRFDTGTAGTGGIRMFGDTGETMTLMREDNPAGSGDPRIVNTAGRAIDMTSAGAGNVVVTLTDGDPTSEASTNVNTGTAPIRITGSTDAIRAEATGTGSVGVSFAPTGTPSGVNHPLAVITAGTGVGSNGSGILARTTTGAINIDTRGATFTINGTNGGAAIDAVSTSGNVSVSSGNASGRLRGILAQTGGTGTVSVTVAGSVGANGTTGLAGLDTVAGTGATTITLTSGSISGGAGAAIRSVSASTSATAAVNIQNTGASVNGRLDFTGVTAGGVTYNNTTGSWAAAGTSNLSGFNDTVTFATGGFTTAASTVVNFGAGNDTLTLGGAFNTLAAGSVLDFGAGNDTFTASNRLLASGGALSFGSGVDTMNLSGVMVMNGLTITGLDAFNLSGTILMGGGVTGGGNIPQIDYLTTDAVADDVLVMTDGTFTGSGGRVAMDFRVDEDSLQAGCATLTGAADCLDLRGASTAGQTLVTLNYIGDLARLGSYSPVGVTLVDVAGAGTSAAGHFVIDPNSPGYVDDPMFGGAIGRPGLFVYALRYDPANQRHALVGMPRSSVMEYAMLSGAAQSIWHMTADTVTDRQTDLREATDGGSVWMRASGEYTQRDVGTVFESFGQTFVFDNSYKLYAGSVIGGMDFAVGSAGGYDYVVGGQIGYVGSSFDLAASESAGRFSGATGGLYASLWSPQFFVDGTVNANVLTLNYEAPALSSKTNTYLNSLGGKVEGGARLPLGSASFVEPIATLAFVRTSFEEISLSGGEVKPADAESLRGAVGLRFAAELGSDTVNASYFLTGRAWNEFEGESRGVAANPGTDLTFADDLSGVFGEAEAGVSLNNAANTLSGFFTSGVKFKDGYSATNLSLGLRMAW